MKNLPPLLLLFALVTMAMLSTEADTPYSLYCNKIEYESDLPSEAISDSNERVLLKIGVSEAVITGAQHTIFNGTYDINEESDLKISALKEDDSHKSKLHIDRYSGILSIYHESYETFLEGELETYRALGQWLVRHRDLKPTTEFRKKGILFFSLSKKISKLKLMGVCGLARAKF